MSDKEKVKKGLQCIIDGTVRCERCGYAIDKHGHYSCQQECAKDAISLLKEQEAVAPTVSSAEEHDGLVSWWYQCGKCKMPIDYGDRFCRYCGQAVKWDEID